MHRQLSSSPTGLAVGVALAVGLTLSSGCDGGSSGSNGNNGGGGGTDTGADTDVADVRAPEDTSEDATPEPDVADVSDSATGDAEPSDGETDSADGGADATRDAEPADGGDGESTRMLYRMVGIVQAPSQSRYFAARFGGGQPPERLPEGCNSGQVASCSDVPWGDALGMTTNGDPTFVLDRRCADDPSSCQNDPNRPRNGMVRRVSLTEGGEFQRNVSLALPEGVYDPSGVAWVASKQRYYVGSYRNAEIRVYDNQGDVLQGTTYDTSMFDADPSQNGDSDPEVTALLADGDYVLVLMEMLETVETTNNGNTTLEMQANSNSRLAVIDTGSESWVDLKPNEQGTQALELPAGRASAGMVATDMGNVAIGLAGSPDSDDGGIVLVERNGPGDYAVDSTIVEEGELVTRRLRDFVLTSESSGFAIVSSTTGGDPGVVHFDVDSSGDVERTEVDTSNGAPTGGLCLTPDERRLMVGVQAAEFAGGQLRSGYLAFDTRPGSGVPSGSPDAGTSTDTASGDTGAGGGSGFRKLNTRPFGPRADSTHCTVVDQQEVPVSEMQ
jgi:hypothetical protein